MNHQDPTVSRREDRSASRQGERLRDVAEVIAIRDPEIDIRPVLAQIRARVAKRRAEGAYRQDLDAVADEVFRQVVTQRPTFGVVTGSGHVLPIKELKVKSRIHEPTFVSRVPVAGAVILLIRRTWYRISSRRSVRVIIRQVQDFHNLAVTSFKNVDVEQRRLAHEVSRLDELTRRQAHEVADLRADIAQLQGNRSAPPPGRSQRP